MSSIEAALRQVDPTSAEGTEAAAPLKAVPPPTDEDSAVTSLSEQLDDLYAEMEYLTSRFPNHTVRSITDLALSLQQRLADAAKGGGEVTDHGLIPGAILAQISQLTQEAADQADVGIVEVDDSGVIKLYNNYESELAGVAKESAIGKNFFLQVAPCTNNRLFLGAFKAGVQSGSLDKKFNYTFTYKMKPTPVVIHLYREGEGGRNFVFVKKR
jgi:photoactive yellow protein